MRRILFGSILLLLMSSASAFAQQTTGNITGRIVDDQGAAIPGVSITAKNPATGFTRTETSDAAGVYRLSALPVGVYEVLAELTGFQKVATISETVTVTGATPLIETTSSGVGGIVSPRRIETIPLNGRQFANLAATIPGVGLG